VIYVVKKGDTLGGIALAFGVSVEALQALNGDVQPAYLSVGRALTIPVTAAGAAAPLVPLGPAFTPYPVMLSVPACYPQATGALYCLLEAHNPGQTALENISARVLLVDGQGGVVQETEAALAVNVLPPGGAAPLAALFPAAPEGWAGAVGRLSSAVPAGGQFAPLEVVAPTGQALAGQWTVTGQVRNGTALAVQAAWVVLTVYDPAGQLVGYRKAAVTGPVPAGGSVAFAVSAAVLGGTGERYQVIAEGQP
jgi:murein DD-endopeptidase MepM/ murein hydrolase activator NlpD